jgi:hypothetical protein
MIILISVNVKKMKQPSLSRPARAAAPGRR